MKIPKIESFPEQTGICIVVQRIPIDLVPGKISKIWRFYGGKGSASASACHMRASRNAHAYTHMHACTYTHMHACTYTHMHACTYTHIRAFRVRQHVDFYEETEPGIEFWDRC